VKKRSGVDDKQQGPPQLSATKLAKLTACLVKGAASPIHYGQSCRGALHAKVYSFADLGATVSREATHRDFKTCQIPKCATCALRREVTPTQWVTDGPALRVVVSVYCYVSIWCCLVSVGWTHPAHVGAGTHHRYMQITS
jgi:hypothetical protein